LVVLFAFHRSRPFSGQDGLLQHPEGDPARERRGVFALRSPFRPNPIGSTVVRVISVEGNKLVVSGLDAHDGTPILDLKKYTAWVDEPQDESNL
jgi:tRNA-Thr(GGU) m(6)t(6)A37 methyltransferase TsaA